MKFVFFYVLCLAVLVFFNLPAIASATINERSRVTAKRCGMDMIVAMDFVCPEANFTLPYELRFVSRKFFESFKLICLDRDEFVYDTSVDMFFMADCRKVFSTILRAETSTNKPVLVRFA